MTGGHLTDGGRPEEGGVAGPGVSLRRQGSLRRVDRPEAAIEAALIHAGQIDLIALAVGIVTLGDVEAARRHEIGRRVEVSVEGQGASVRRHIGRPVGALGRSLIH